MNGNTIKTFYVKLNYIRTLPAYLCVISSKHKSLIQMDIKRWLAVDKQNYTTLFSALNWFLSTKKEFRNLLLHRLKNPSRTPVAWFHYFVTRIFWKPIDSLYLYTEKIGGGLYIQHGFSTIVSAQVIGENCWINQQVTIGYRGEHSPVIENNVSIYCGAKVLGNITLHDNCTAGAGAIVIHDVPANAVVVGYPARIKKYRNNETQ